MKQRTEDIIFYISVLPITVVAFAVMIITALVGAMTIWNVVGWLKYYFVI